MDIHAVPGGDPILGAVIAMFFIVFGAIVAFALTSATFPRSASPYVAESRILAPWIGWPAEVNQWINWVVGFNLLPSTYFLFMALIPGLYAMGVSSGNPGLIVASTWLISDVRPTLIIGEVFLIGCLFLAIGGTRKLMQFQLIVTAISFIVTALIIGLYATTSSAHFMELVPKYLGNTYNGIVAAGNSQVPSMMVPISYQPYPLLVAAAFSAGSVNTYWNAYGGG